jgi:hypothetical protein
VSLLSTHHQAPPNNSLSKCLAQSDIENFTKKILRTLLRSFGDGSSIHAVQRNSGFAIYVLVRGFSSSLKCKSKATTFFCIAKLPMLATCGSLLDKI